MYRYTRTIVSTETIEFVTPVRPSRPTSPAKVVVETNGEEVPPSALRLRAAVPSRPSNVIQLPAHAGLEIWNARQERRAR